MRLCGAEVTPCLISLPDKVESLRDEVEDGDNFLGKNHQFSYVCEGVNSISIKCLV